MKRLMRAEAHMWCGGVWTRRGAGCAVVRTNPEVYMLENWHINCNWQREVNCGTLRCSG